jgi:hypothetical protein
MVYCFALIDLWWKEGAIVNIPGKIPTYMHVEEYGDTLITPLRQTPLL